MKSVTETIKSINNKKIATIGIACFAAILLVVFFAAKPAASSEETVRDAEVTAVTMEHTLTAAGEIEAAKSEEIAFDTAKSFRGMCVEEGDQVRKGQHLISYSDGTYTDAPAAGVVAEINAPETGNTAGDSNTVVLDYTDTLLLSITVPEEEINLVEKGDDAQITVNADSSKTYEGKVTSIKALSDTQISGLESSSTASSSEESETGGTASGSSEAKTSGQSAGKTSGQTASYTVKLKLDNDGSLKLGMSASCTVVIASSSNVAGIPVEAVLFDEDDEPYVYQVDGKEVAKKKVEIGESDPTYVEITKGLQIGDVVRIGYEKESETEQ